MSDDYQPIACGDYDIYEIAIMRGQLLQLKWRQAGAVQQQKVRPLTLKIENRAEYLYFQQGIEEPQRLRLDKIISAQLSK